MTGNGHVIAKMNKAAKKHRAQGTKPLGILLIVRFDGTEVPVADAEDLAKANGLDVDKLPQVQERSALRKGLHKLGIRPSAHHGQRKGQHVKAVVDEDDCLRYSRLQEDRTVTVSIRKEGVDRSGPEPRIVDRGEVQCLTYDMQKRELKLSTSLLHDEIERAFREAKGLYKSNSIRRFAGSCLRAVEAVKFAGSTWFVPDSDEATDLIPRLRRFCRALPNTSFTAVTVMDEPGGREDITFHARESLEADMAKLADRLALHRERRKQGVKVRDDTMDKILEDGRELREKMRTLHHLLKLEHKHVESSLKKLNEDVRAFLLEEK